MVASPEITGSLILDSLLAGRFDACRDALRHLVLPAMTSSLGALRRLPGSPGPGRRRHSEEPGACAGLIVAPHSTSSSVAGPIAAKAPIVAFSTIQLTSARVGSLASWAFRKALGSFRARFRDAKRILTQPAHSAWSVLVEKASSSGETSATVGRELVGGKNSRPGPCW